MAFIAFPFIFGGIYFYPLIRRQSFRRAGCFLCPAGGQPGRAGAAPAWGREERGDATVGKEAALAAHGNFGDVLESQQNLPAPGCELGPPGSAWKLKGEEDEEHRAGCWLQG